MKKTILILTILSIFLSGCKIDFTGDLYTSDLTDLANSGESMSINLPMEIAYGVSACEEVDQTNRMISTYFINFKFTGCTLGEDFSSYATAQVSVPVVNNYDAFTNGPESLIGFVSYLSEDKNYVYVDATINYDLYLSLKDYVYNETFQELSLSTSNLIVRLNNDLNSAIVEVPPSFVNSEPVVNLQEFQLARRELLVIKSSNVTTSFLEKNAWTPLFQLINTYEN